MQYWTYQHGLTVTRGSEKTEKIKVPSAPDKSANIEQLHARFTQLYEEGYTLQSSAEVGSANAVNEVMTYVFMKP